MSSSAIPPKFQKISRNVYVSSLLKPDKEKEPEIYECGCHPDYRQYCGITCVNRLYFAECDPNLCLNGYKCQNRRFQNREWHKTKVRKAGEKGYGLFAKEKIKKYDFIIEYVGEIIDAKEATHRLEHTYLHSGACYILSLGEGYLIDATNKGNRARFCNHSCSPNCITQKWSVLGEPRVGLFALRDIEKGEELGFDYQFISYGEDMHACLCGSVKCRRWIGAKEEKKKKEQQSEQPTFHRQLNETKQHERNLEYLKRLNGYEYDKNNKHLSVLNAQIAKGLVCNKIQMECDSVVHEDADDEQSNEFDALLYRVHYEKMNLNIDQIKLLAEMIHKKSLK